MTTQDASAGGATTSPSARGLFHGFEGYVTPSGDDYQRLLSEGIVVPDTNVLLNLYRYNDSARDALIEVLSKLGDRLWVPHQVLAEFWRNREGVLRDPRDTQKTVAELAEHRERAVRVFRTWANRVSLPDDQAASLSQQLIDAFSSVSKRVDALDIEEASGYARDTSADPVLGALAGALNGRCGQPLDPSAHAAAVTEGLRRVEERLPPGYKDKSKGDLHAAGDYIVWEQVLLEAERQGVDVLFVTGDVKDDWWREEGGERRGPRLELVDEMRTRANVRLYMLRPTSLLQHAQTYLGIDVEPESVRDVERVEQFLSQRSAVSTGGWTATTIGVLLTQLADQAPVQEQVIRLAAKQGGHVSREQIYQVGGYDPGRSLRGFTRPVNRLVQDLRDRGVIDAEATDVLFTNYDGGVLATGFSIADEVVGLVEGDASRDDLASKDPSRIYPEA